MTEYTNLLDYSDKFGNVAQWLGRRPVAGLADFP